MAVDSIHATYSYKYFFQKKNNISYSLLHDRHWLFYLAPSNRRYVK